ncbi:MAG: hypothetical protein CMG13_01845 [Candidatus Marinimicrobia bacterium]|nr:hypothetical protein [Candidatus Neomarinimicrobiota bacterium]
MTAEQKGQRILQILSAVFIASLVACNLIFQKFFILDAHYTIFVLSVGILPYPITFLITDIVSEIYGKEKANKLVLSGFFASIFTIVILMIADSTQAVFFSPIDNPTFHKVFGLFGPAVLASMCAYLLAQFIDIRVFHFLKDATGGRYFWLRNNFSTLFSQMVDTASVLILLCVASDMGWSTGLSWERFPELFVGGYLFKVSVALLDTPIAYLCCYFLRKRFNLKIGESLK